MKIHWARWIAVLVMFVIIAASGISLYLMVENRQNDYIQTHVDLYCHEKSDMLITNIQQVIQQTIPFNIGMKSVVVITNPLFWNEMYHTTMQHQMTLNLSDVTIIEKVNHVDREMYESRLSTMFDTNITIKEFINGSLVDAHNKSTYYPINVDFVFRYSKTVDCIRPLVAI